MPLQAGIQLVLQYYDPMHGRRYCRGFMGLPITSSHYICVDASSTSSELLASQIGEGLANEILQLSPNVAEVHPPCGGNGHRFCHALREPDCKLAYLPVVDASTPGLFAPPPWTANQNSVTIPLILPGVTQANVPPPLRQQNQLPAVAGSAGVVHDILRSIGVLNARPRLFISYLRAEASALAEQLHTELGRKGFEVFLDRFSIAPGVNFQQRLDEELMRMGTVLFIESKNSSKSNWIRHEIDFALLHRLGTISVRMPGSAASDRITPDDRIDLSINSFTKTGRLKKSVLHELLLKISSAQMLSEAMRLNYLIGTASDALSSYGFQEQSFSNDQVIIARRSTGREHAIRISGHPAELHDFHTLDPYTPSGDSVIIAPGSVMDWRRKAPVEWLARRIDVKLKDESELADFPGSLT